MGPQANMVGKSIQDLDTPALLVDLAALDQNIATMKRVIIDEAGVQWRPHTKAIKTPAIAHMLLRAGAQVDLFLQLSVRLGKLGRAHSHL